MSLSRARRSAAAAAVLTPLLAAGVLLTAGPAAAVLVEGDPSSAACLRLVELPGASPAGSSRFVSHGYVAVLVPRAEC
jgi:hypothetical protein